MNLMASPKTVEQPPVWLPESSELTVVLSGLALGGAERIVLDWASRVYPRWQTYLIVLRDSSYEWPVPEFIRTTRLHGKQITEKLQRLGQDIARSSNPVCLCHLLKQPERDALSSAGACVIPVLHNSAKGWLEDASCIQDAPYVITVSRACAEDLYAHGWKGYASIIHHLPSPRVFPSGSREYFRENWHIPANAFVIGMIGAVKPQKDYPCALRILAALRQKKDTYLVIVGGPIGTQGRTAWTELIAEMHRLNLRHRVALPGFIADAARCMPAFDVMLNTSHFEGLSIATQEALANGVAVVSGNVDGQGEICHPQLVLVSKASPPARWVAALDTACTLPKIPSTATFPSYRLWTLAHLARPIRKASQRKILFVTANLNSGGAQRSLTNLAKELQRRITFEIAVCGDSTASYFFAQLQDRHIPVFRTGPSRDAFDHAESLVQKICSDNIGTVCFWNLDPKIKLLLIKTLHSTGVRFIDVSPGNNSFDELANTAEFQKRICFSAGQYYRRLDAVALKYRETCLPSFLRPKTTVIPNGVPKPPCHKSSYAASAKPRILVQGRIAPTKFLREIIAAVRIVWQTIPGAELHIFGTAEPRHQSYAQAVSESAGFETGCRIFFHGTNFEIATRMADFDTYIVLGKDQGCPNALLEAMAVGLPVIANDDGGTHEQVLHNRTGVLLKSCAPEEVAYALKKILTNRSFAEKIGRRGRRHVLKNFSMRQMVQRYIDLFEGSVAQNSKCWR